MKVAFVLAACCLAAGCGGAEDRHRGTNAQTPTIPSSGGPDDQTAGVDNRDTSANVRAEGERPGTTKSNGETANTASGGGSATEDGPVDNTRPSTEPATGSPIDANEDGPGSLPAPGSRSLTEPNASDGSPASGGENPAP